LHPVIMAGGSGTRFWPRSRLSRPKQLLQIVGEGTMIEQTFTRLRSLVESELFLVITNIAQADAIRRQLPALCPEQIVAEPVGRDTAAAIGLAALMVLRKDPQGVMAVLTADHVVRPARAFVECIKEAVKVASEHAALVTFGVKPSGPSTLYGYIRRGEPLGDGRAGAYKIEEFKEKPDRVTAEEYLKSGEFYWNSGNFVWRASDILAAIESLMPELFQGLERIRPAVGTDDLPDVLKREYPSLPKMSIDYGVMEKADNAVVLEARFEWDDVGAWDAVARHYSSDENGNTVLCRHVGLDSTNCIVVAEEGHVVATAGVDNLIVVQTSDATLVCDRRRAGDVKEIVNILKARGLEEYVQ